VYVGEAQDVGEAARARRSGAADVREDVDHCLDLDVAVDAARPRRRRAEVHTPTHARLAFTAASARAFLESELRVHPGWIAARAVLEPRVGVARGALACCTVDCAADALRAVPTPRVGLRRQGS
jgi:hypothetical protein